MAKPYTPIDCNFYDYIEHFAVKRRPIEMVIRNAEEQETLLHARILDTLIQNGEEFMIVEGLDAPVRMDRIVRLEQHVNPGTDSCAL